MASPEVLDVASLLTPIAGDSPVGSDIRLDATPSSLYYQLKDARNKARAAERRVPEPGRERDLEPPDWRPVLRFGKQALAERTKDLEVTAYLIEALVRLHGFPGLRDGFQLARGLVEQFWDGLYPLPDEEGMDTRVAPLAGLNGIDAEGTLRAPIFLVPIAKDAGDGAFGRYHYEQALELAKLTPDDREKRTTQKTVTLEKIQRAIDDTDRNEARPIRFFVDLLEDIKQCEEEYQGLNDVLEQRCGKKKTPPSSIITRALADCRTAVEELAKDKLPPKDDAKEGTATAAASTANGNAAASAPGTIRQRDDALHMLLKVADFFRRTEPHNPVSYVVEYAVSLCRMSLPELMTELISDEQPRKALFKQVGIKPREEST